MDGGIRGPYPAGVKPEEWLAYEEMYAAMRQALGTPRLVFEVGSDGLYGHDPARPLQDDREEPKAPREEARGL
jgi:hypothetical protein